MIVPSVGCLTELVPPEAGIVYDPEDDEGLRRSMLAIQERDIAPMRAAALERALELDGGRLPSGLDGCMRMGRRKGMRLLNVESRMTNAGIESFLRNV